MSRPPVNQKVRVGGKRTDLLKRDMTPEELESHELVKKLKIAATPDPPTKNRFAARSAGKKHGLGVRQYWAHLFRANEGLSKRHKMTDEEIKRQMLLEYPDRPSILRLGPVGERGDVTVNYYRNLFNVGKLTRELPPVRVSFRYNNEGEKVDGRTGRRRLSKERIAKVQADGKLIREAAENAENSVD